MLAAFRALPLLWQGISLVAVVSALGGAVLWLVDVGYDRGMADCQAKALKTRTEIETRWIRDADQIAQFNQERDDAVAAIDRADAGSDVCLDADSVQRLRAIR